MKLSIGFLLKVSLNLYLDFFNHWINCHIRLINYSCAYVNYVGECLFRQLSINFNTSEYGPHPHGNIYITITSGKKERKY